MIGLKLKTALVITSTFRVIAETSFSSQKFQDFVLTGAERWLEVIQDWITYGKVIHFILFLLRCIFSSYVKVHINLRIPVRVRFYF